jgi:pimeloyl-ACP methyl ester carboxylesterase
MSVPATSFLDAGDGVKTAYKVYDNARSGKRPLVMIQGLSACGNVDYIDLALVLCKTRTVVTLDNRDIGESTWQAQSKSITLQDLANDVVTLVRHLGYKEIDLLGHSMGGECIWRKFVIHIDLFRRVRHDRSDNARHAQSPIQNCTLRIGRNFRKGA